MDHRPIQHLVFMDVTLLSVGLSSVMLLSGCIGRSGPINYEQDQAADTATYNGESVVRHGVGVRGEVVRPGFVSFSQGMTAADAIEQCGGIIELYAGPIYLQRGRQYMPIRKSQLNRVRLEDGDLVYVLSD